MDNSPDAYRTNEQTPFSEELIMARRRRWFHFRLRLSQVTGWTVIHPIPQSTGLATHMGALAVIMGAPEARRYLTLYWRKAGDATAQAAIFLALLWRRPG